MIVDSIKMALTPLALKKMNTTDNHLFYKKSMLYSSYVLMLGIITISLFSYEILKIIAKSASFWSAWMVVPILALSVFFVNMRETTSYGLLIKRIQKDRDQCSDRDSTQHCTQHPAYSCLECFRNGCSHPSDSICLLAAELPFFPEGVFYPLRTQENYNDVCNRNNTVVCRAGA